MTIFCGEKERDELYCPISEQFKRTKHVLELCDRTLNRWISEKNSEQEECYERRGRPVLFDSFDRDLIGRDIGKNDERKQICDIENINVSFENES